MIVDRKPKQRQQPVVRQSLTGEKTIIVRTLGPTLTQFGVANALNDPALELRNAQGTLVDSNDNWKSSPKKAQIQASGLAPPNLAEPAVLDTLPMGNYTAIVRGVGAMPTGLAILEISAISRLLFRGASTIFAKLRVETVPLGITE